MSLFHRSHADDSPVHFSHEEAVVALLFLTVTADGVIAPVEEELVIGASNRMKLLRGLSIDQFNDAVHRLRDAIEKKGRDVVFTAAVAGVPAGLNRTLYALAADVVFADGVGDAAEIEFLRKLQEALGIPDDAATNIVEVMRLKNSG